MRHIPEDVMERIKAGDRKGLCRGITNHAAKLDEQKVREMRQLWCGEELPVHEIAARFGVGRSTVYAAVTRRTWRHVG